MALKHKIEKLEDVPESVRGFYEAGTGGFFLQVEGMVPKSQIDEFRNNNIELLRERDTLRETFKDVDVVKYREMLAAKGKTPEEIEAAVRARVAQLTDEHAGIVNTLTGKLTEANQQLDTLLVDGSLRTAAATAGILPTALDDVILRGRMVFKRDAEGNILASNTKGERLYDKDGTSPLSMESWVKDLKKGAPHLFEGMRGAGGQGSGSGGSGGSTDTSKMTPAQKIQYGLNQMRDQGQSA